MISVSIDGGAPIEVDMYAPSYSYQQVVFEQAGLSPGSHTLRIVTMAATNPLSTGSYADLDAVEAEGVVTMARFENTNPGLVFSSSGWWTSSSSQRSGGSSQTTIGGGKSLDVVFEGPAVRLLASTGPNRGMISVSIDGGAPIEVDMYAPSYSYEQTVFEQAGLSPGSHTLRIVTMAATNPLSTASYVDLDAVDAEGVVPMARFENTNPGLVFSPFWWTSSSSQRSGGSSQTTIGGGKSLDVVFEGPAVRLLASPGPNRGMVSVSIDGGAPIEVDMYAPSYSYQQVVFQQAGLSPGSHTLRIVTMAATNPLSTASYVDLDAVEAERLPTP
jgi:hypothetical protein